MRFLLGIAEAGFFPGILLYLTYWIPSTDRANVVGWLMVALPVSGMIGSALSGELMRLNGLGLEGWQWMLLLEGVPAIVLGFVCLALSAERAVDATWLQPDERAWLTAALASERHAVADPRLHDAARRVRAAARVGPRHRLLRRRRSHSTDRTSGCRR